MKTIGTRIADFRKAKGLSQRQLASKIGISNGYLADIEKNIKSPSLEVLNKIAEGLGVHITTLLSDEDNIAANFQWYFNLPTHLQDFLKRSESRELLELAFFMGKIALPLSSIKAIILSLLLFNEQSYGIVNIDEISSKKRSLEIFEAVAQAHYDKIIKEILLQQS